MASVWVYSDGHIAQGTVKNNDYYFGSSTYQYNNEAEKLHVICQEIGHTLGLDHQSTDGSSLGTCMDYYHNTNGLDLLSMHPNAHDYDQLVTIYKHLDSFTTVNASSTKAGAAPAANGDSGDDDLGAPAGKKDQKGRDILFVKDLGGGKKILTFVIWTL